MKKFGIKKIIIITMFTALFTILSLYGTINLYGVKITIQNLPLFIVAILYGPFAGAFCGLIGMLINQVITYGITITTIFWVLPHTVIGFLTGYIFEKSIVRLERSYKFIISVIVLNLLITVLNTVATYIDSKVFGYYSFVYVFGSLIVRVIISIVISIIFSLIIPSIIFAIKKSG